MGRNDKYQTATAHAINETLDRITAQQKEQKEKNEALKAENEALKAERDQLKNHHPINDNDLAAAINAFNHTVLSLNERINSLEANTATNNTEESSPKPAPKPKVKTVCGTRQMIDIACTEYYNKIKDQADEIILEHLKAMGNSDPKDFQLAWVHYYKWYVARLAMKYKGNYKKMHQSGIGQKTMLCAIEYSTEQGDYYFKAVRHPKTPARHIPPSRRAQQVDETEENE